MTITINLDMRALRWLVVIMVAGGAFMFAIAQADGAASDDAMPTVAFLARADNPVDALAAAPIAGALGAPVFLTFPESLGSDARNALLKHRPDIVILAGGKGALSDAVESGVRSALPSARIIRKAGTSRTSTAAALADLPAELGFSRPVLTGATVEGDVSVQGNLFLGSPADWSSGSLPCFGTPGWRFLPEDEGVFCSVVTRSHDGLFGNVEVGTDLTVNGENIGDKIVDFETRLDELEQGASPTQDPVVRVDYRKTCYNAAGTGGSWEALLDVSQVPNAKSFTITLSRSGKPNVTQTGTPGQAPYGSSAFVFLGDIGAPGSETIGLVSLVVDGVEFNPSGFTPYTLPPQNQSCDSEV